MPQFNTWQVNVFRTRNNNHRPVMSNSSPLSTTMNEIDFNTPRTTHEASINAPQHQPSTLYINTWNHCQSFLSTSSSIENTPCHISLRKVDQSQLFAKGNPSYNFRHITPLPRREMADQSDVKNGTSFGA